MSGLSVRSLSVTYRRRRALRNVDLDAPAGAVTGIVGPNGAGKSTLLKAVVGLVRPDTGTVLVDGRPVDEHRRHVAYLPQRSAVDWDYPAQVREVVAMGRYPHRRVLRRATPEDRRLVAEAIERVGLAHLATRQIGELSGGQQQRVFLARALAQEASLLLLDEPFAGVDAPTVALLSDLLAEQARAGVGVVLVNHDLAAVGEVCDHLVLLDQVVVADGAPAAVLTPDLLARAYGAVPVALTGGAGSR